MFDMILRGGRVVDADAVQATDVAISGGRIAARLARGEPAEAAATLDLTGRLIFPGLVDAHVHLREPGLTHQEDFVSGSRAAAVGGVTTLLVMPTDRPWTETPAHLAEKIALARARTHVDLAFQVALALDEVDLAALQRLGAISFELFTADVPARFRHETLHDLIEGLRRTAATDVLACISPGDQSILTVAALAGGRDVAAFAASRPPAAEAQGLAKAVIASATIGKKVHIRQINSALGTETFGRLKGMADVTAETTVQNLIFVEEDYSRLGAAIKASPPFRRPADVASLREAVRDGTIDIVATDHAPHSPAEKAAENQRFADIPGGLPGLQTLLPVMLHLVDAGVLRLTDIARLCAANPASRFGLGHRKGRIAVGLDADIVVVDPEASTLIRDADQFSKARHTPFHGLVVPYGIERVFLRGTEIATSGSVTDRATGQVLGADRE
jgi:dihydroorotase